VHYVLIYIQHSYNTEIYTSTRKLLFVTWFGYFPPSPLDVVYGQQRGVREDLREDALKVEKLVENIKQIHLQVQEMLNKSQEKTQG
jgi:hypothetical protein